MNHTRTAFINARRTSGMTFDELAATTGLARQTLVNISGGHTHGDLRTWLILARTWNTTLDELLHPVWEPPTNISNTSGTGPQSTP